MLIQYFIKKFGYFIVFDNVVKIREWDGLLFGYYQKCFEFIGLFNGNYF